MYPSAFSLPKNRLVAEEPVHVLGFDLSLSIALICSHRFVCMLFYHAVLIWEHFTEHKVYARLYVSSHSM